MDWTAMPPLTALRAFTALAQEGSQAKAGERLNVSHAAISQQVRNLEEHLGLSLVERDGRSLRLTPEGARLARVCGEAFGSIRDEVAELTGADADRPLQISTTPMFAAGWLAPRISAFRHRHPGVDLMLNPTPALVDPEPGGVDLAIRFGDGHWPGHDVELLLPTDLVIVAARSLVGDRDFADPCDLLGYPWLQEVGTTEAMGWLRQKGVTSGRVQSLTHLPGNLVLDGLRNGDGISSTTRLFVEREIAAGRLRVLFDEGTGATGYHLVTRPGVMRPPLKAFVAWLRREAATYRADRGEAGARP